MTTAGPRFLQLADVAEVLNISAAQAYALVRSGDLPAIKIGGRGQWRVEASVLEEYIQRMYAQTRDFVTTHPLGVLPSLGSPDDQAETDTED
jgi:excisionase family DNA binding protein